MNLRRTVSVALVWLVASASLAADLKYTVRVERRQAAMSTDVDPMLWMLGQEVLEAVTPNGPVELTIMVRNGASRVEWSRAIPGIPEGAILLQPPTGNRFMLNPTDHTYWRVTMPNLYGLGEARRPVVTLTPGTQPETVAGVDAIRSDVEIEIPFVEARRGEMVSGTPTELPLEGEVWTTDRFAQDLPARLRRITGLAILGFDVAPVGHLVLRQILRGPLFGDFELESIVTTISEDELAEALFEIPEDFKQVPPPRIGR